MGCLKALRWTISVFLIVIVFFLITIGLPLSGLFSSITKRENVKKWLKQSGIYSNFTETVVELMAEQEPEEDTEESLWEDISGQLDDPETELSKYINKKVSPKFLEDTANSTVDAYFNWFEGKVDRPELEVSIIEGDDDLLDFLSVAGKEKLRQLNECPAGFTLPSDFNPYETDCVPQGYNIDTEIDKYIDQNKDNEKVDELEEKTKLSIDNSEITNELTSSVQLIYKLFRASGVLVVLAVGILSLLLLLLIPGTKKGLIITGVALFIPSLIVLVFRFGAAASTNWILEILKDQIPVDRIYIFEIIAEDVVKEFYAGILRQIGGLSIIVAITGIVLIVIGVIIKKKKDKPEKTMSDSEIVGNL